MILLKWYRDIAKRSPLMHDVGTYCKKCGKYDIPLFHVQNKLWNKVVGKDIVLCINCFDKLAKRKGIQIIYGDIEIFGKNWLSAEEQLT